MASWSAEATENQHGKHEAAPHSAMMLQNLLREQIIYHRPGTNTKTNAEQPEIRTLTPP